MYPLPHKMNAVVEQNNEIEGRVWQFFLQVMLPPELALYLLDLCSYIIIGIRKQHFLLVVRVLVVMERLYFSVLLKAILGGLMAIVNVKLVMGKNTSDANDASPKIYRCIRRLVAATQEPDSK